MLDWGATACSSGNLNSELDSRQVGLSGLRYGPKAIIRQWQMGRCSYNGFLGKDESRHLGSGYAFW